MLTVKSVSNPVYGNAEGTHIDCMVEFEEIPNEVLPFGANEWDPMEHGQNLYTDLKAGKYGEIAPYVAPTPINAPSIGTQKA